MANNSDDGIVNIWKHVEFTEKWKMCNTSRLDEISPSWFRRKDELQNSSDEFAEFMEYLKRQHAIETGVIENMYDISKGVTETLIERGFAESLISHGDFSDNVSKDQLMNHLRDHLSAVDAVFDFVKNKRVLSVSFIKQLHETVTEHQESSEGRDQFGNKMKVTLLRGKFKERENNPSRQNGNGKITYKYCPPVQVESEMDNLVRIYDELLKENIHPVIIASWFHHAFTTIHPFQDGNGRMARLLASLILIKFGLFPLTVLRDDARVRYIGSLEDADNGNPQPLVDYFISIQRGHIERALNLKPIPTTSSLEHVTEILTGKLKVQKGMKEKGRIEAIARNRNAIYEMVNEILNVFTNDIKDKMEGNATIYLTSCKPDSTGKQYYFTHQIANYAARHGYYFNRFLPKGWFRFAVDISESKGYQLIITQHHFGYQDDSYAIGAILEFIESEAEAKKQRTLTEGNYRKSREGRVITNVPLDIAPYKVSLSTEFNQSLKSNVKSYLEDVLTLTLSQIASEIT